MSKSYVVVLGLVMVAFVASICSADDTLVGYWALDEGQGTDVKDSSGMENNGVLMGDALWKPGVIGSAIEFSRAGATYVEAPDSDSLDVTDQLSITAWIKPSAIYTGTDWKLASCIVSKRQAYYLCIATTGVLQAYIYNVQPQAWLNGVTDMNQFIGQWVHVALVYDGAEEKIYVNGVLEVSEAKTGTITVNDRTFTIGWVDYERFYEGLVDEVKVWSRGLDEDELAGLLAVKPESKLTTCWGALK